MTPAPKRRWREIFLLILAIAFSIAWGIGLYRHPADTVTQWIDEMREWDKSEVFIQSSLEDDGNWYEYRLTRKRIAAP